MYMYMYIGGQYSQPARDPLSIDEYGGFSPDYVIIDLDREKEKQYFYLKCQFYLFLLMRIRKIIINACHWAI